MDPGAHVVYAGGQIVGGARQLTDFIVLAERTAGRHVALGQAVGNRRQLAGGSGNAPGDDEADDKAQTDGQQGQEQNDFAAGMEGRIDVLVIGGGIGLDGRRDVMEDSRHLGQGASRRTLEDLFRLWQNGAFFFVGGKSVDLLDGVVQPGMRLFELLQKPGESGNALLRDLSFLTIEPLAEGATMIVGLNLHGLHRLVGEKSPGLVDEFEVVDLPLQDVLVEMGRVIGVIYSRNHRAESQPGENGDERQEEQDGAKSQEQFRGDGKIL